MQPAKNRRKLDASSEVEWNSSTIPAYSLPEHSTKRLSEAMNAEKANRYEPPDAVPFTDWFQGYFKSDSTGVSESKLETKSGHRTPTSNKVRSPKSSQNLPTSSTTMGTTKVDLRCRRALHKKEWNMTTMLTWRKTCKYNQFQNILDSRIVPVLRNDKYKNVRPQYMNPRKRYDIFPPKKKKRRPKPLVFPVAQECSCDKDIPKSWCPITCPCPCPLSAVLPSCCSPLQPFISGSRDSASPDYDQFQPPCCLTFGRSHDGSPSATSVSSPAHSLEKSPSASSISSLGSSAFGRSRDTSPSAKSLPSPGSAINERPSSPSESSTVTSASRRSSIGDGKKGEDAVSTKSHNLASTHDKREAPSAKSKDTVSSVDGASSDNASKASTPASNATPKSKSSTPAASRPPTPGQSSSKPPASSPDGQSDAASLARTRATLGFLPPPPGHEEYKAKAVATAAPDSPWWLNPGICRMRFPNLACLGEFMADGP
ncbi:hypothetical protein MPTK1_1g09540 [Marchantia polymorpha subsp. ruderalis]|uniref:Uncharacterized protein n=2 Tax=Marchantia polymorpha TaxID=3197 RepID=A0AAF6ANB0_MARPO|nr:hypothetical protein MARPO_0096s0046 [Marchantia polymorpha]BBM97930.1 hypothetical protein Mp_1g09540 [Marchantia polymorpha subsp. ruderalis]|eukprot:PTQ32699.1 hypothetical protein MARPO_0096s0046 [Marchantia polymorpha]